MKTKKILIILLIMTVIIAMFTTVKGATGDSYKITLTPTAEKAKAGETVTIKMTANEIKIQSGEKGIGSYQGKLEYDTAIFEEVKMKGNEDWDTPMLNEGAFTSVRGDGECTAEAQEIGTITLKVKAGAKIGETNIKVKEFGASNGVENIATSDVVAKVTIEATNNGGGTGTGTGTGTSSGSSSTTGTTKKPTTSTTKSGTLPKTGVSGVLVTVIGIIAISGIYSYIRYKKLY